jgi:hypothetical protein
VSVIALRAYAKLVYFYLCIARISFAALCDRVRDYPLGIRPPRAEIVAQIVVEQIWAEQIWAQQICAEMDMACIWYPKEVLCLQRSAATACLLKQYGVPAQMVIGAQQMPFRSHAWVEVEGRVVNDKPYTPEIYSVLERC